MPSFSKTSRDRLSTCDIRLQQLFNDVVVGFDCTIIEGHRPQHLQDKYFAEGKSKVKYPDGKHNKIPSQAVDVAPYLNGAISWNPKHCLYFAGYVMGMAKRMNIPIRSGCDWDMDMEAITDQTFQDLVHFELLS